MLPCRQRYALPTWGGRQPVEFLPDVERSTRPLREVHGVHGECVVHLCVSGLRDLNNRQDKLLPLLSRPTQYDVRKTL